MSQYYKLIHKPWCNKKKGTINAVKFNLTRKSSWYFRSALFVWYCRLSALHHCTNLIGLSSFLVIFGLLINVFLPPPPPPPPLHSPSLLSTQCDGCLEDCMRAHGWVSGITSHASVILSRGQLVTVEAPVHVYPRQSSSIHHNAVVKL